MFKVETEWDTCTSTVQKLYPQLQFQEDKAVKIRITALKTDENNKGNNVFVVAIPESNVMV